MNAVAGRLIASIQPLKVVTEMETPDTYRQRAEAAERRSKAAADKEAKRILQSAAQRWRQLADICEQILQHEKRLS
jgi:hypothetical protein